MTRRKTSADNRRQKCGRKGKTMGKNLENAKIIRNDPDVHYNCAQAMLCAFAEDCGLTREQACGSGANF